MTFLPAGTLLAGCLDGNNFLSQGTTVPLARVLHVHVCNAAHHGIISNKLALSSPDFACWHRSYISCTSGKKVVHLGLAICKHAPAQDETVGQFPKPCKRSSAGACLIVSTKVQAGQDGSSHAFVQKQMHVVQVELPLGATEDRICGTIDIERALQEGIKAFEPGLLVSPASTYPHQQVHEYHVISFR